MNHYMGNQPFHGTNRFEMNRRKLEVLRSSLTDSSDIPAKSLTPQVAQQAIMRLQAERAQLLQAKEVNKKQIDDLTGTIKDFIHYICYHSLVADDQELLRHIVPFGVCVLDGFNDDTDFAVKL